MKFKVLGSVSPYCKSGWNCPGYLIYEGKIKLLLDCGNGITRNMNFPDDLENLNIIISHLHKDHYGDLGAILYASFVFHNLGYLNNRINVYIPKDTNLEDFHYLCNFGKENYMTLHTYTEKDKLTIGNINISFFRTKHPIYTLASSLKCKTKKITYSADTGYDEEMISFIKDSDLFICETTFLEKQKNNSSSHLSTIDAAFLAKASNVKKLLITHFFPEIDKDNYLKEVLPIFPKAEVAIENKEYILK